ncbi:MAG: hypothetical protein UH211_08435 [Agathobacter sp.]|nr:hypothetical protein [Agathobacter sp.]
MEIDEKSAILEIVNLTDGIDFAEEGMVEDALSVAMKIDVLRKTKFGKRFLSKLNSMRKGECKDNNCILCGKNTTSSVVCEVCLSNLRDSAAEYTRNSFKEELNDVKDKKNINNELDIEEEIASQPNTDTSTDRTVSENGVKSSGGMLTAILIISLLNTISIITIAIIVFYQLGLMK